MCKMATLRLGELMEAIEHENECFEKFLDEVEKLPADKRGDFIKAYQDGATAEPLMEKMEAHIDRMLSITGII